jgi:hypothetical protein
MTLSAGGADNDFFSRTTVVAGSSPAMSTSSCSSIGRALIVAVDSPAASIGLCLAQEGSSMDKIEVKNEIQFAYESLCHSCSKAQIVEGYRESERIIFCMNNDSKSTIPFRVRECTAYNNRDLSGWEQLERLAIDVLTFGL